MDGAELSMPDLDTLQTFFSLFSQYRFRIPDYQRGYAWGDENKPGQDSKELRELLEDIATLTDENEHFTGLLVLHENHDPVLKIKTHGMIKPVYDVVDGQQRLTTIVILMNEIRRVMTESGDSDLQEIANVIQNTYLFEPGAGNLQVPKLVLDENNRAFFERNILEIGEKSIVGATMKSHENLQNARTYFAEQLQREKEIWGEGFNDWLEALYRKVNGQLKVMVYRLRSESDAGVVFESMNSRGKKPNSMDLVKNYLLFAASKLEPDLREHLSNEINHTWTTIFKRLNAAGMADEESRLLEFHWLMAYDADRKRWGREPERSDHIKKKFKALVTDPARHQELYESVLEYVQTLQNAVVAFTDIHRPKDAGAFQIYASQPESKKQIIRFGEKLARINILRPFTPLLMAIRLCEPENVQAYLDVVQVCEKYAFRVFRVAANKTSSSEDVLFRLGNQFFNGKITLKTLLEQLQRDLYNRCGEKEFAWGFSLDNPNKWYGKNGPNEGLPYLLYEYEEFLHGNKAPIINWEAIYGSKKTIEHILPQNPEQDGAWLKRFTPEQAEKYKHTLGNLTLTEDNSKLGRKSFADKKGALGQENACYVNSKLQCEFELAKIADWTPETIEARQTRLAEWAAKRWFVPAPPPLPDKPFEALKQRAEANGFGEAFRKIHEIALKLGLPPKANKNRMSYKMPGYANRSVIMFYTYANSMEVYFHFKYFPAYKNVPGSRIREIFENNENWWNLNHQNIDAFLARLEQLADEVEANKAA